MGDDLDTGERHPSFSIFLQSKVRRLINLSYIWAWLVMAHQILVVEHGPFNDIKNVN